MTTASAGHAQAGEVQRNIRVGFAHNDTLGHQKSGGPWLMKTVRADTVHDSKLLRLGKFCHEVVP